jgi:hypothetical protein
MLVDLAGTPMALVNTFRETDFTRVQNEMGKQDSLRLLAQSHLLMRMSVELATMRSLYYGTKLTEANNSDTVRSIYEGLNDVSPMMAEQWRETNDLTIVLEDGEGKAYTLPMASYGMNLLYGRALNEGSGFHQLPAACRHQQLKALRQVNAHRCAQSVLAECRQHDRDQHQDPQPAAATRNAAVVAQQCAGGDLHSERFV